jgi:hypothetical protein
VKIVSKKKEVTLESLLLSHPGILHSRWTDGGPREAVVVGSLRWASNIRSECGYLLKKICKLLLYMRTARKILDKF